MERTEAIYTTAKHYAKLLQGKPEQRLEFRKAISALWRTGVYTYAEYNYVLGYVYKSLGLIERNTYRTYGTKRVYKF